MMLDNDTVGQFAKRVEIALGHRHFDLAHRIVDEAALLDTSPADPITLDSPLAESGLSVKSITLLEAVGIFTIGDALKRSREQLSMIPNVGETTLREIVNTLRNVRLRIHE